MDERGQFTFYRSFWEAIKSLPKKDKLPILEAIIEYALDGKSSCALSQSQSAFFLLVKPTLDASRKKAANGKLGGKSEKANGKQTESKTEANDKQTASEKENKIEKENEEEIEIEGEDYKRSKPEAKPSDGGKPAEPPKPQTTFDGQSFSLFWNAYPDCASKISRENAYAAWKALAPSKETAGKILSSLEAWKKSSRWTDKGGEYIPSPANFLTKGYWKIVPTPVASKVDVSVGRPLDADEIAAIQRLMKEPESIPDETQVEGS